MQIVNATVLTRRRALALAGTVALTCFAGCPAFVRAASEDANTYEFPDERLVFTIESYDQTRDGATVGISVQSTGRGYVQVTVELKMCDVDGFVVGAYTATVVNEETGPLIPRGALQTTIEVPVEGALSCKVARIVSLESLDPRQVERELPFETVVFGSYPQSGEDPEPIEWLVLAEKGSRKLLLAKDGLDCEPYNEKDSKVTWEDCTLRSWLNSDFLDEAFTRDEQEGITEVCLANDDNPDYETKGGTDTYDRVFLLSLGDVQEYFGAAPGETLGDLICRPTDYALDRGAYLSEETGGCYWWLRSPGLGPSFAASVCPFGGVSSSGSWVVVDSIAVRPALWVSNL